MTLKAALLTRITDNISIMVLNGIAFKLALKDGGSTIENKETLQFYKQKRNELTADLCQLVEPNLEQREALLRELGIS